MLWQHPLPVARLSSYVRSETKLYVYQMGVSSGVGYMLTVEARDQDVLT
jgi:hypothetical protein